MEENEIKENKSKSVSLTAVGLVVIVLVALGLFVFIQEKKQIPSEMPDQSVGQEERNDGSVNESEVQVNEIEDVAAAGNVVEEAPAEELIEEEISIEFPTVTPTLYSIYIGLAKDLDTATETPEPAEVNEVVVGYEWEVLLGSPFFATIALPEWDPENQSATYAVSVWDDLSQSYMLLDSYHSKTEIEFPRDGFAGARVFKVTGIDPDLRICPSDRSFTWDARFTFEGDLGLVRTPITQKLPEGETCRLR